MQGMTNNQQAGIAPDSVGRHAQVVPSVIASRVTRPLECWSGVVSPPELLNWCRASDLTDKARQELRKQIVKRLRPRMADIWALKIGIDVGSDWEVHASSREKYLMREVAENGLRLSELTLHELKSLVHMPLEHLFAALAHLESLNWVPPPPAPPPVAPRSPTDPVDLTDTIREKIDAALLIPWLPSVTHTDLRFPFPTGQPLPEWLRSQRESTQCWHGLENLLDALMFAEKATAQAEVEAIARICITNHYVYRVPCDHVEGRLKIFSTRYLRKQGCNLTLQQVGDQIGITRERVRQVCDQLLEAWKVSSVATPAIDRALRMASRIAPAGLKEINEQIARYLGEDLSIEALCSLAEDLEIPMDVVLHHGTVRMRQQAIPVRIVGRANDDAAWIEDVIRFAKSDCSLIGCSSVIRIAGVLALESGVAIPRATIEAVIERVDGFRWLDRASSWFTFTSSEGSAAALRIMKVFAVAHRSVSVEELGAALLDDEEWLQRGAKFAPAIPPQHILRDLLSGWHWLEQLQHTRFALSAELPDGVLNPTEKLVVEAIEARGGSALRREIVDFVRSRLDVSDVFVSFTLARSPAIRRWEKNIYGLRGRPIPLNALEEARERNTPATVEQALAPGVLASFRVNITKASLVNEQYNVPAHIRRNIEPDTYPLEGREGSLTIGQTHVIRGLNRLFPEAKPGDTISIELLEAKSLRLTWSSGESLEDDDELDASKS